MSFIPNQTRHDYFHFFISIRYFLNWKKAYDSLTKQTKEISKSGFLERIQDGDNLENMEEVFKSEKMKDFNTAIFSIRTFAVITITNSAFCLEALINDYASEKMSRNYFSKYIEKLDVVSKWVIVPNLLEGKGLDTGGQGIEYLRKLVKDRNDLVHPKSKTWDKSDNQGVKIPNFSGYADNVGNSVNAIAHCTKELRDVDDSFKHLDDYKWVWGDEGNFKNISDFESLYASMFK